MIPTATVIDRMNAVLDAEGSGRYSFDRDFEPAINYAVEFLISVMNNVLGNDKLSEENLRELVRTKVWQTSQFSRIHFTQEDIGEDVWSIIRVSPEPLLSPETDPIVNPTPANSLFVPDVTFVRSEHAAARLTEEEWNEKDRNTFSPGNNAMADSDFRKYGYQNFATIRPGAYVDEESVIEEIEISPYLDQQFVAVSYLVYPQQIESESDNIPFPKSMLNLVVQRALNFVSSKQGDGTNLYSTSQQEVAQLVALMS